jgi:hypothetical protein
MARTADEEYLIDARFRTSKKERDQIKEVLEKARKIGNKSLVKKK